MVANHFYIISMMSPGVKVNLKKMFLLSPPAGLPIAAQGPSTLSVCPPASKKMSFTTAEQRFSFIVSCLLLLICL